MSGQCQAILTLDLLGQRQAVSMVSKQNRHSDTLDTPDVPDTPTLDTPDTPTLHTGLDAKEVQASIRRRANSS